MLIDVDPKKNARNPRRPAASPALNTIESEVVGFFIQLSRVVGLPRSVGEIYGLLFISARPLAMEDLIERLGISKGSASQGLKFLRDASAIQMVYVPTDRRIHYEAVTELRSLVARFLSGKIIPHLDTSLSRLDRLSGMARQLSAQERGRVIARITMLRSWQERIREFLPMLVEMIGGRTTRSA